MNLKELKLICKAGEGQFVEFKMNANQPSQIAEEVVGFANAKGGSLFVGVDDNGTPCGLKFVEDDAIFLTDYINQVIEPPPLFNYEIIPLTKARAILHFIINSGHEKPYGIKETSKTKKVFYRVDDLCIQASRELKNILRRTRQNIGLTIKYTELEDRILKLIERDNSLSKTQICQMTNFSARKISDCLIRLVTAGVLKIIPSVNDDLYEYHR